MNYGLYLAAGGALSGMHRQDVLANNLANVNTTGFKPDFVVARQRLPERLESNQPVDPQVLLEKLGGGLLVEPTSTDFEQGALRVSNNPLDMALEGPGFFQVESSESSPLLTRDGRMTMSHGGELVLASNGKRVLDDQGLPIRLVTDQPVQVRSNGDIVQNGEAVARLKLVQPRDTAQLSKHGDNLFRLNSTRERDLEVATEARVLQGHVEASGVDPILTLNAIMNTSRAVQGNLRMMQYHDTALGQAVNTLGKVT